MFLPSWDEVTKVYGNAPDKLKAFAPSGWTWLRDTCDGDVLGVVDDGGLYGSHPRNYCRVRPAFVLDLSKVNFTKVEPSSSDEVTNDVDVIAPVMVENAETKFEEPVIVETNNNAVIEDNETPTVIEEKTATDVIEEPSTSEPVNNETTEATNESDVVTKLNTEEEIE